VVVIAILAAITIVSYNNITNRANASSAKSTASTVQKKIELYAAEQGRYPIAISELTATGQSYTLASASFGTGTVNTTTGDPTPSTEATKGTKYVRVMACKSDTATLSATNVTGARIVYYDYEKTSGQLTNVDLGTNCGTNLAALN
jgi:type II secretory pathway pseudopilin PulG